jgi:hypothetical protein
MLDEPSVVGIGIEVDLDGGLVGRQRGEPAQEQGQRGAAKTQSNHFKLVPGRALA